MINLYDILDAADGQLFGEPAAQIFTRFSFDARAVRSGDLFVALKTERGDGHHFMEEALRAGAVGLMCTRPPSFDTEGITVVIMRDVEAALMRWARYILEKYGTTVVAVAGSVGKSTTIAAIAKVLGLRYQVFKSEGEFSGKFGVPLALGGLESNHQLAILEFDPNDSDDMREILAAVAPTVGVALTLQGDDARSPDYEPIAALIASLPTEGGLAVLNFDHSALRELATRQHVPSLTVSVDKDGTSFGADLTAYQIISALDKTGFDLRYGSERHVARWIPLLGAHQLYAALAALAVGLAFDVPLEDALIALTTLEPLAGRLRPLAGVGGALVVDDSYNASGQSAAAALDWLTTVLPRPSIRETQHGRLSPRGRVHLVFGEMDNFAADLGEKLADVANTVIAEGESAAPIARIALDHGLTLSEIHMTYAPSDSAATLKSDLTPKDVIVVMGNKRARMERVVAELLADPAQRTLLPRQDSVNEADYEDQFNDTSWVEVDMEAIAHNISVIKTRIGPDCQLMAVLAADAYGHGAVAVGSTALMNGADALGVATLQEGIALREGGLAATILVMGYIPAHLAPLAARHDLTLTLYDTHSARAINRAAGNHKIRAHVRLDVGIVAQGLGIPVDEVVGFFRSLVRLEAIEVAGIYTALDMANPEMAEKQLLDFVESVKMLKAGEFTFQAIHAATTAAAFALPDSRLDMVRVGAALFGLQPENQIPADLLAELRPTLAWRTVVAQVKRLPAMIITDENGLPTPTRARTVAILPVGFADGFRAGPQHARRVLIKGQSAPLIAPIRMNEIQADISAIPDVRAGDEVVLIGKQGDERITPEEIAAELGTSSAEVLAQISPTIPRRKGSLH